MSQVLLLERASKAPRLDGGQAGRRRVRRVGGDHLLAKWTDRRIRDGGGASRASRCRPVANCPVISCMYRADTGAPARFRAPAMRLDARCLDTRPFGEQALTPPATPRERGQRPGPIDAERTLHITCTPLTAPLPRRRGRRFCVPPSPAVCHFQRIRCPGASSPH